MTKLTFESWRAAARPLLAAGTQPQDVDWTGQLACSPARVGSSGEIRLPRRLMILLERMACFRHAGRWELMYRLAWRIRQGQPRLLEDCADPDVAHALGMDRAVRRDVHKMHAFVRFSENTDAAGMRSYVAWFEPQHEILRRAAPFFVKRFPNMSWVIATPDGAAPGRGLCHGELGAARCRRCGLWRHATQAV